MADTPAQDTQGQVAQPDPAPDLQPVGANCIPPRITDPARQTAADLQFAAASGDKLRAAQPKEMPKPEQADVDALKANPYQWRKYQSYFGKLPEDFQIPTPTAEDVAALKKSPQDLPKFKAAFGDQYSLNQNGNLTLPPSASGSDVISNAYSLFKADGVHAAYDYLTQSTTPAQRKAIMGTPAGAAKDVGQQALAFSQGMLSTAQPVLNALRVSGIPGTAGIPQDALRPAQEQVIKSLTPEARAGVEKQLVSQLPGGSMFQLQLHPEVAGDPYWRANFIGGLLPMAATDGITSVATRATYGIKYLDYMAQNLPSWKGPISALESQAAEAAQGAAAKAGMATGAVAGGVMFGDQTASSVRQQIDEIPTSELRHYAPYVDLRYGLTGQKPMSDEEARAAIAQDKGLQAFMSVAAVNGVAGLPLGKLFGKWADQVSATGGKLADVTVGATAEGVKMAAVGGGQQLAENVALQPIDQRDITAGVGSAAAETGLMGAAMGGMHGAAQPHGAPKGGESEATDAGAGGGGGASPAAEANANAIRKMMAGEPVSKTELDTLIKHGYAQIGGQTGKPQVLPAGRRALSDFDAQAKEAKAAETGTDTRDTDEEKARQAKQPETQNAPTTPEADRTAVGLGGEEPDTQTEKAPRTPSETEDLAGQEARNTANFEAKEAEEKAARSADEDRAYADQQDRQALARDKDFVPAKNQVGHQTEEEAPHMHGGDPGGYLTTREALDVALKRPAEIAATIPRMTGLDPVQREIESRFVDHIASDLPGAIEDYSKLPDTMGGKIISTDEARQLSEDYQQNRNLSQEVHEPASWLANVMFKRALAQPPKPGEDNMVLFTAGGTGSGKSSELERAGPLTQKAQLIYDTVLNGSDSAHDKIDASLQAGKWVSVAYTYRDPVESFKNGTLYRASLNGRVVPAEVHAETHAGAPEAIRALMEKYKDDPRVQFVGIDNSRGDGKAEVAPIEDLLRKPSKAPLGKLRAVAREALADGKITPEVYERTMGEKPPSSSARGEDRTARTGDGEEAKRKHAGPESRQPETRRLSPVEQAKLARVEARTRRILNAERSRARNDAVSQAGPYTRTAEAIPQAVWNTWRKGGFVSAHDVLERVISSTQDPRIKALATALRKYAPNIRVDFNAALKEGMAGRWLPGKGPDGALIEISGKHPQAQAIKAVMHEFVHAAVADEMERNWDGPLATKIRQLHQEARDLAIARYGKELIEAHDAFWNNEGPKPDNFVRDFYGLLDPHEFVAEALSNPHFQDMLTELTPPTRMNATKPTGIFTRFVQIVRDFLSKSGVGVNSSLLEDVISTSGEVMKAQAMRLDSATLGMRELATREDSGDDVSRDVLSNRMTKLVTSAVELGATKIARGIVRFDDWADAMKQELGDGVRPALDQLYQLAKDKVADINNLLYKTRDDGSLVGGPSRDFKKADIAPLRAQLRRLAREGEFGKDWYQHSSQALIDSVGGNKAKAKQLAGLFSIYSAGASVDGNTTMALRAWYQWEHGETIKTGTADADELAVRWLETGVEPTGMKRSNFYGNLLQALEGDHQNLYTSGVTVDRWMMRALGYNREAPTDAQYAFVADQIRQVAKGLKWTPEQVQAAVWVAIKSRWEQVADQVRETGLKKGWIKMTTSPTKGKQVKVLDPERYYGKMLDEALKVALTKAKVKQSARNFADSLMRHKTQISWEAMPGVGSGRLAGAENVPVAAWEAFQHDVSAAHVNPQTGNDALQEALGLLHAGHIEGNSTWFRDPGQVMRFRHWGPDGLTTIDPAKQGTGAAGQLTERNRSTKVTSLYPYELGEGQPEETVANGRHEYVVEVPAEQLYDASRDPRGYKDAAMEPIAFDGERVPTLHAYNHDEFERMVKDAGFKGYYVSEGGDPVLKGQARLFEPWPAVSARDYAGKGPELYAKAGAQEVIYAPAEKGALKTGSSMIDPDARRALESYAAALGKLNNQDSVGWHRPRFGANLRDSNGMDIRMPNAGRDNMMRAYKAVYDALWAEGLSDTARAEFAPIETPDGFRFINWGAMDNRRFQAVVREAMDRAFPASHPEVTPFAADGGLIHATEYDSTIAGNAHRERLDGVLADIGKRLEPLYREFAQRHGLRDPSRKPEGQESRQVEVSAPVSVGRLTTGEGLYNDVMGRFGHFTGDDTSEQAKLYPLTPEHARAAESLAKDLGYQLQYFSFESDPSKGVDFRLPQLGKNGSGGYRGGNLWIYDPRNSHGAFNDVEYTRAWRIGHELGHAITEPFVESRYGASRRYGRLGLESEQTRGGLGKQTTVPVRPLTLAEAQRAVEWEDVAFRAQRVVMEKLGVPINDAAFAREYNLNIGDAMYRVLSGDFGDPGQAGFVPSDKMVDVRDLLKSLQETERGLAAAQGRAPTDGIDLDRWAPVTDDELRKAIEAKQNKDVKFSVVPKDVDYAVRAVDREGSAVAGEHEDLHFNGREDAEDYVQQAAAKRAADIGGTVSHEEGWSTTRKGGKIDRTYSVQPVSKDPYANQGAPKGTGTPADNFLTEWHTKFPEVPGAGGDRLINGNVLMGIVRDHLDSGGSTLYITNLRALNPGHGDGTAAIREAIGMADKHGSTLELNAVAYNQAQQGTKAQAELEDWYRKAGFREVPGATAGGTLMRREPNATKDVPVFQTNAGKGISPKDAAEVMKHAQAMFPGAQHHLVDSIEEAPHEVQAQAAAQGVTDRVAAAIMHDYDGTHVYLIRNNMTSVEDALHTVMEEHVGHAGVAATFGPKMGNIMDGFLRNAALKSQIAKVADRWGINVRAPDLTTRREAWRAATEEWLAHVASAMPVRPDTALSKVVGEMKLWLASKGVPVQLGNREARLALMRAADYVNSGRWLDNVSAAKEAAERDRVQFSVVPKTGNTDLDELLNDKIGAPKIGWRTRLSAAMHDIRSRLVTSGLDRMNRVKEYETDLKVPPAESGYISMRLSTNVSPMLRNLIEFGGIKWTSTLGFDADKSMVSDYHAGVKPLNQILAPLHNDPAMQRLFEGYLVALRARELASQGRENLLEPRHIQAGLSLAQQYPHFVQMQRDLAALNRNVLDFAERAGVIDPESRKMWESDYYVPFYRVTDEAGGGPWSAGSMARVRNPVMRLLGGKEHLNDVTGNIVRNWSTLVNASIKAHAVRVAVDNLSQAGVAVRVPALELGRDALVSTSAINKLLADHGITAALSPSAVGSIQKLMSLSTPQGDDVVQVWRGGKREYYRLADPQLAVAFGALRGSPLRNLRDDPIGKWIVGAGTMPKMLLTKLTTDNPAFGIRTLWKDNINAWTVGRGAMPVTPVVSAISGLAKTMRANDAFKRMAAAGATFNAGRADPYDTNLTAKRYITAPSLAGRLWDGYRDMMLSGENASRVTIYERQLAATGSHKLAAFEARDLMDYAMRGNSPIVQFMVETVPFWGAHVQGLYKTARAMNPENSMTYAQMAGGVAKRIAPLAIKATLLSLAASALYMHNRQNQDYMDLPDLQKELYYHLYVGGYHIKIPKAFESGTLFGTVPEAITEAVASHLDPQTVKEQLAYVQHAFGAALNLYPRVTAVTPLYELATNHDTSTGYPILSEHDQGILPGEQQGPQTSPTVAAIAHGMPDMMPDWFRSPKQLQHLIQGYLGIMGSYALNGADFLYRKAAGLPAAPERNLGQIPVVGSFITKSDEPPTSTKSLGELSDVMIQANQMAQSITSLEKQGDDAATQRAIKLQKEHIDQVIAERAMRPASDAIRELQNEKRAVMLSPDMSAADKRTKANEIQRAINDTARKVYDYRPGGKLNREVLEKITSDVTPADKARYLRTQGMPALASIALQYGKGNMPPSVQAAIEELS